MFTGINLGAALLLLLVVVLVRRRWRREANRKEEVRRLMLLAAAEEERAEREAAIGRHVPAAPNIPAHAPRPAADAVAKAPPAPPPLECALCSSPATGRCARCKAVRYCSGKCQIIHWRQGHKEECHPPSANVEYAAEFGYPGLKNEESNSLNKNSTSPENLLNDEVVDDPLKGDTVSTSPDALVKANAPSDKTSEDASWKEKDSGSSINASVREGSTPSHSMTAPFDASASIEPPVPEDAGRGESSPDVSSDNIGRVVDISGDKSTKGPIPVLSTGVSEENKLPPSHLEHKTSLSRTGTVECLSDSANISSSMPVEHTSQQSEAGGESLIPGHVMSKAQSPVVGISSYFEAKMSSVCALPESTSQMEHTKKPVFNTTNSDPVTTRSTNDTLFQNKKISRSSSASGSKQFSSNDVRPTAFPKASQVASMSIQSSGSMDSSCLNGLPTSVNGNITQLPSSKISRNYPSELMLFPYDLFIKLYNDQVKFHPCGLINSGNSCYANVVLQCLLFTRPLATYFFEGLHSRTCPKKEWCFTCELERLFMNSKQGISPLSPMGILSHLEDIGSSFGRGKQEDAHEFLRYAIDAMQSVCLKETGAKPGEPLAEETTLIQQTYGGYLRSKIICSRCKGKSERNERIMDLAVEIDGDIDNIEEALNRFTSTEILDGENKYKCNRCKSYERAEKQLTISEAPNVLTIALKRFQSGKFGKLNKVVRFHDILDLASYMHQTDDKTPIYRLYAVVVHIDVMNASSSGHYICYVKDTQEKWYEIDDSKVKPVELEKVLTRNAYILFYARCLPRAPSLVRKAIAYELMKIDRKRKPNLTPSQHSPSVALSQNHLHPRNADDPANSRPFLVDDCDSSSLFSCSDEGSCSTDSTKDSTTSDESLEHLVGEMDHANSSPLKFSPDSNGITGSPLSRSHSSDTVDSGLVSDSSRSSDSFSGSNSSGREDDTAESGRKKYIKSNETPEAGFVGKESPPFLYPDKSKQSRHLTGNYRSRETDWINTSKAKSGVVFRRPSREGSAQTFY